MIYRRWSLLTGPAAMVGGIVAAVVVANYTFVENVPFLKPTPSKKDRDPSTK